MMKMECHTLYIICFQKYLGPKFCPSCHQCAKIYPSFAEMMQFGRLGGPRQSSWWQQWLGECPWMGRTLQPCSKLSVINQSYLAQLKSRRSSEPSFTHQAGLRNQKYDAAVNLHLGKMGLLEGRASTPRRGPGQPLKDHELLVHVFRDVVASDRVPNGLARPAERSTRARGWLRASYHSRRHHPLAVLHTTGASAGVDLSKLRDISDCFFKWVAITVPKSTFLNLPIVGRDPKTYPTVFLCQAKRSRRGACSLYVGAGAQKTFALLVFDGNGIHDDGMF